MTTEELAINGGPTAKRKPFPDWPMYDKREIAAVTAVLESRHWWRGNGSQVMRFEQEFAAYQAHTTRSRSPMAPTRSSWLSRRSTSAAATR
jgi:hypothetical protein